MTSVTDAGGGRRVGLLGGTFDPPHVAHLRVAVSAQHALALDEVLLVPNGDPWQKRGQRAITPAIVRLEMVEAAVAGLDPGVGVRVSDVEVRRAGPSFTLDTVAALRAEEPDVALTVILGRDAAALLPTWERHRELLELVEIGVVERPGSEELALPAEVEARAVAVPVERLDVSSSGVRDLVARDVPIDVLVAPAVVAIIAREGLYRA